MKLYFVICLLVSLAIITTNCNGKEIKIQVKPRGAVRTRREAKRPLKRRKRIGPKRSPGFKGYFRASD
ncbi:unnamed protein product [Schistosoma haematobium]|nr:unnamed protein product [Schistosoma haematobium]CAH8615597.1 unnamed protein product [Schistosoma haematobium]